MEGDGKDAEEQDNAGSRLLRSHLGNIPTTACSFALADAMHEALLTALSRTKESVLRVVAYDGNLQGCLEDDKSSRTTTMIIF